jgi:hypothetical protein
MKKTKRLKYTLQVLQRCTLGTYVELKNDVVYDIITNDVITDVCKSYLPNGLYQLVPCIKSVFEYSNQVVSLNTSKLLVNINDINTIIDYLK